MNDQSFTRFSNETSESNSTILKNTKELFRKAINAALIVAALALLGCFDFLHFEFHFEAIMKWEYWLRVLIRSTILILMFNVGTNLFYDKEVNGNVELNKFKKEFEEKNKLKDLNFEYFIERVLNPKIKKEAWIKHIQKKIYKLEKHAKPDEKVLFFSELPEKQEKKAKSKYCRKKQKLLDLIDKEYLDQAIDYIDVKYQHINPSIFNLDIAEGIVLSNYKVKSEEGKARSKKTISSVVSMVFCSMALSSIFLSPDLLEMYGNLTFVINAIVSFLADITFATIQLFKGVLYTKKLVNQEQVIPYANRVKILDQYLAWNVENPESKVKKITNYIENQK